MGFKRIRLFCLFVPSEPSILEIMYQQPYFCYSPRFVVYFLIHLNSFIEKVALCVERMHYALCMHGRLGRVIVGMGRAGHQKLQSVNALELMSIKVALIANCFQFEEVPSPWASLSH